MLITGIIADPFNIASADGTNPTATQGKQAELLVAELHGKYHTWTYRGRMFSGSTAQAGITVPSSTSLSPTFCLWNPTGSNVLAVPTRTVIQQIGATVATSGAFGWAITAGPGTGIATGGPVTAFNGATPVGGYGLISGVGAYARQSNSAVKLSVAGTNTLTNLPAIGEWLAAQLSSETAGNPNVANGVIDYDGQVEFFPGSFASLCFSNASGTTASVVVTQKWIEIPV